MSTEQFVHDAIQSWHGRDKGRALHGIKQVDLLVQPIRMTRHARMVFASTASSDPCDHLPASISVARQA